VENTVKNNMKNFDAVNEWAASNQERELLAMRGFYADSAQPCTRVHAVEEIDEPLEKTRLYGPFSIEVMAWVMKVNTYFPGYVKMGWDSNGSEYIQY
jgi:hypothetical protein